MTQINKPKAIIVDIDGTIADARHRLHHIKREEILKEHWDAFFDAMVDDPPIDGAWDSILTETSKVTDMFPFVIFLTGRPNSHYHETNEWIKKFIPLHEQEFALLMRRKGDHRPDTEVKFELYDKLIKNNYDVILAFEDRPSVVKMWNDNGLKAIQVGDGIEF